MKNINNSNYARRFYSDINEFYHKEKIPKNKKKSLQHIKTDQDLLFYYRNKELNTYKQYCFPNKQENILFKQDLEKDYDRNIKSEIYDFNNVNLKEINSNNILKKVRSGLIKKENDNIMKKYEIYKNSDFEEYEKKYTLEKSNNENKSKEKSEKEKSNKITFSSDNVNSSNFDLIKVRENIEIKTDKTSDKAKLTYKQNDEKLNIRQFNQQNQFELKIQKTKEEKTFKDFKEIKINFEDLKLREEKFNALKKKLEMIKNNQKEFEKKISDKDSKIKDINIITEMKLDNLQEKFISKYNKNNKVRSLSSKISSTTKQAAKSQATINQNDNSKINKSRKISLEKEIQNLKISQESEPQMINPESKKLIKIDMNSNTNNSISAQAHSNILSNRNIKNKENISKDFKQVLNNLNIDNILQKTKMIFNKQLTFNSNLTSSRNQNNKEFDLKTKKISSNENDKNNLRSSWESTNKYSNSDNVLNEIINPQMKKSLKDDSSNNSNNNQTSTIIINNNININTYIDKGELIYSDNINRVKNNLTSKENKKYNNKKSNYKESDDNYKANFFMCTNHDQVNDKCDKYDNYRNSVNNFSDNNKINKNNMHIFTNLNSNPNYEKRESSINKKIPSSTKDLKRGYSDNDYKSLLLCSYESGVKNSEFKLDKRLSYYNNNKHYERIKDNLKIYESIEKYPSDKTKSLNENYLHNLSKNRISKNIIDDYRDSNNFPSYLVENNKRLNRPNSHIGSIDFDNKTSGVDYLFNYEQDKNKPSLNFFNKYDNSLRLNNINY